MLRLIDFPIELRLLGESDNHQINVICPVRRQLLTSKLNIAIAKISSTCQRSGTCVSLNVGSIEFKSPTWPRKSHLVGCPRNDRQIAPLRLKMTDERQMFMLGGTNNWCEVYEQWYLLHKRLPSNNIQARMKSQLYQGSESKVHERISKFQEISNRNYCFVFSCS